MNILITGKGSYIGKSIKEWLERNGNFKVHELDLQNENWTNFDFSLFDSVIHVAAIVHRPKENIVWETYYKVNTLLPEQVAKIARAAGIKQFIFFSSMSVYGQEKKLPFGNVIKSDTPLKPITYYGKSKYEAERLLMQMSADSFRMCVVRPPNIYGKNCPGNYFSGFVKITKFLPIFPKVFESSKQSFLYIDNLSEFVRLLLTHNCDGVFMPQDIHAISTVEFVQMIAIALNKKIYFSRLFGVMIRPFWRAKLINKLYGGVSYDSSMSQFDIGNYLFFSNQEGVRKSIDE